MDGLGLAALAGLLVVSSTAAIPGAQQISVDSFATAVGQHATAVEPDSLSAGRTVVAVFQLGRVVDGGATGIGWATSVDGGETWRSGVLPQLTVFQQPAGSFDRVSDPVVAYDRVHGVWLASALALRGPQRLSSVVVSRSVDGLSWSAPVFAAAEVGRFDHDKPWATCGGGRCYAVWTSRPGQNGVMTVAVSTDGGLAWSEPIVFDDVLGSGWQPIVRPDGGLVVVYEGSAEIAAVVSRDGGRSFTRPTRVGALRVGNVGGLRAPALPSAEVDGAGRVFVAWQDCRFRRGCSTNDVVFASSSDGVRWSRVRRVPTWPEFDSSTHFVPGLAVDASTQGSAARLALTFNVVTAQGIVPAFISSTDAGQTWSAPQALAAPVAREAFPLSTSGRFLGDYISTSFVDGGAAVPVFTSATSPFDGRFHQGVYAVRVPPLETRGRLLRVGALHITPRRPRVGQRVVVSLRRRGPARSVTSRCSLRPSAVRFRRIAPCAWQVVAVRRAVTVRGAVSVVSPEEEATRAFAFTVRP